jgi:hypothetical protein
MMVKCTDCYEVNEVTNQRCKRCGRLLDDAKKDVALDRDGGRYEWQHHDAPNTIVRRDRSGSQPQRKVW